LSNNYLIVLDVDAIHDYVFATNRLKEIRGASSLIDELILEDVPHIADSFGYETIYSAGGTSLIKTKDVDDEDNIKAFINKISDKFKEKTHIATFTAEWIKYTEETSKFQKVRDDLYNKLKIKKLLKGTTKDIITNPFFKFCMTCGAPTAEEKHPMENEYPDSYVCTTCYKRIVKGNKVKKEIFKKKTGANSNSVYAFFFNRAGDVQLPKDLSGIGACSLPDNYIGFIYADGNRIGEKLKNIDQESDYKIFSEMLDRATKESAVEAVLESVKQNPSVYPVEFVLAGGDDLIMIVPGSSAIQTATSFCKLFQEKTKSNEAPNGLTTSIGLTISHASYPIKSLLPISETLLRGAKSKGWNTDTTENSMINFLIIKGSMANANRWHMDYQYNSPLKKHSYEMHLTCRPYSIQDMEKVFSSIQNLKKAHFPTTRLKHIREILLKDISGSVLEFSDLLSRTGGKDALKSIYSAIESFNLDFMPWRRSTNKYETPFLDIIELYDFIS
jgi:hypothetical protein